MTCLSILFNTFEVSLGIYTGLIARLHYKWTRGTHLILIVTLSDMSLMHTEHLAYWYFGKSLEVFIFLTFVLYARKCIWLRKAFYPLRRFIHNLNIELL